MKNIFAVIISCILFSAFAVGHVLVSLHYWTEENAALDGLIANILQPMFVLAAGYLCVRLSTVKKWWFAVAFAITIYILIAFSVEVFGPGLSISNWGWAALKIPIGLVVFSLLGGGIYQYSKAKH